MFRMRAKCRRFFEWSRFWDYLPEEDIEREKHFRVCLWAENMAKCSCGMCGNPRRHFDDKTRQEKLFDIICSESS